MSTRQTYLDIINGSLQPGSPAETRPKCVRNIGDPLKHDAARMGRRKVLELESLLCILVDFLTLKMIIRNNSGPKAWRKSTMWPH